MSFPCNSHGRPRLGLEQILLSLTAIFAFVGSASSQAPLPEGAEKATVETICTVCHTTDRIVASANSRQEWLARVHRMIAHGAQLPDNKIDAVVDYLAKNFPPPAGSAGPAPKTPDGKPDLSGTWVPAGGGQRHMDLPLTPWGSAQYLWNSEPIGNTTGFVEQAERQRIELDPIYNCYPPGMVRLGPPDDTVTGAGGGAVEIMQTPRMVTIVYQRRNAVRYIYTDGREHPKILELTWNGDSIGRWDGDTLVVDTVGLRDETWLDSDGHEHSTQLHVVERFRRLAVGSLEIERTLTDPIALARPYTSRIVLRLNPRYDRNENAGTNDCTQYMVRKPAFGKGQGGLLGISDHP